MAGPGGMRPVAAEARPSSSSQLHRIAPLRQMTTRRCDMR
jgi:hypothetical protein